jgi:hypothetical protein
MFNRFRTGAIDRVPATLEEQWAEVEAGWSDADRHERFLAQVSLCGAYAYAASRYRKAARQRGSDAISKLQLERLSRMVHAVMAVSSVRQSGDDVKHYRGLMILLALLVVVGGLAGLWFFQRSRSAAQDVQPLEPSIRVGRGRGAGTGGRGGPAFGGLRAKMPPRLAAGEGEAGDEAAERGAGAAGDQDDEGVEGAADQAGGEADEQVQE